MSNEPQQPGSMPPPIPPPTGYSPPAGYPPQPPQGQYPVPSPNNRVAAGVCGILLGGLGIHKFIYGATTPGIIMIVIGVVGGLLTCGAATAVVGIIGLIEGIIYLTKSDQEFYDVYQVGKKQWF